MVGLLPLEESILVRVQVPQLIIKRWVKLRRKTEVMTLYLLGMDLSFIQIKTVFLIGHLFGLALGAGGAFISDLLFFKSIKDRVISKTEMGFLTLASHCVTTGLLLLIASGLGMFMLDTERYLASSKFLVKMTVVGIIAVNGILLHFIHIPRLKKHVRHQTALPHEFRYRMLMLGSGVISLVSWASAIVLGAFRSIPLSYEMIFSTYLAVVVSALLVAYTFRDYFVPRLKS